MSNSTRPRRRGNSTSSKVALSPARLSRNINSRNIRNTMVASEASRPRPRDMRRAMYIGGPYIGQSANILRMGFPDVNSQVLEDA